MGVCMVGRALRDETIEKILADPPLVWRVVEPDNAQIYLREIGQSKAPGFFEKLFGSKREWPPRVPSFELSEAEHQEFDLDKSWDGINFCVKKIQRSSNYPNLFEDGTLVGKVEVGYGPAMCFTSQKLALIAELYASITEEELLAQYAPTEMKQVYLNGLWERGDEECREYLIENFFSLKAFLGVVAKYNLGVIIQYS